MQLTADIFNLPAERPHLYETSGLGAAIDCAVGLGLHRTSLTGHRRHDSRRSLRMFSQAQFAGSPAGRLVAARVCRGI